MAPIDLRAVGFSRSKVRPREQSLSAAVFNLETLAAELHKRG
jgi:hypothetical protein